jgi:hypothetical protein
MTKTIFLLLILSIPLCAQTKNTADWHQFNYFIGSWLGPAVGQWGTGKCDNQFQFLLNGKYLEIRHRVITPPQEKMPKGEVHQDIGLMSYDKARGKFILRQFHGEGFVNQYILTVSPDNKSLIWETEAIENVDTGWRAKQTWKIVGPDEMVETFELAPPSKPYVQGDVCTYTRQR